MNDSRNEARLQATRPRSMNDQELEQIHGGEITYRGMNANPNSGCLSRIDVLISCP